MVQQLQQRDKALQEVRSELASEKGDMNERIEAIRIKHSETLDELT